MRILLVTCLMLLVQVSAWSQVSTFDEDYFPYPWGAECPFPWDRVVENDWQVQMGQAMTSAHFTTTKLGPDYVVVRFDISDDRGNLLATGSGVYNSKKTKIIGISMRGLDGQSSFYAVLRMYPDEGFLPSGEVVDPNLQSQLCGSRDHSVLTLTIGNNCLFGICPGDHQVLSPDSDHEECGE